MADKAEAESEIKKWMDAADRNVSIANKRARDIEEKLNAAYITIDDLRAEVLAVTQANAQLKAAISRTEKNTVNSDKTDKRVGRQSNTPNENSVIKDIMTQEDIDEMKKNIDLLVYEPPVNISASQYKSQDVWSRAPMDDSEQ